MKYEFGEDSALLLKNAKRFFKNGSALEMGSGTGEITYQLAVYYPESTFTLAEIDDESFKEASARVSQIKNTICVKSDLFLSIAPSHKFDTIMFNPPYLPNDKDFTDKALHGGKIGNELTIRFLEQAKPHLNSQGFILFIASSLSRPEEIEARMQEIGLSYEIVDTQSFFFEKLLVYRAIQS